MPDRRARGADRVAVAIGLALGVGSWPTRALAYRPFDSTDADIAKVGELQFEIGPFGYLVEEGDHFVVAPAIIANAGILGGWELVLEGKNRVRTASNPEGPRDELGDVAVSLKTMLREGSLQERAGLSVASEVGALLPTTQRETGLGASAAVIVSHRSRIGAAHLNGGSFLGRTHHPGVFAGLILEGPFEWRVRPVAEGFFEREFDVTTVGSGLVGFVWKANDRISLDGAVRVGRAFDERLLEVRAGLTWGFEP
jgi:hypothetical protein